MKTLLLSVATFATATSVAAQTVGYVENKFSLPIGPYFSVVNDLFRIKGASDVRGLGSIGRVTGKGWLGLFTVNGYDENGFLGELPSLTTRIVSASGKSIANAAVSGNAELRTLADTKVIDGAGNLSINTDEAYSVFVVKPSNWNDIYPLLNQSYTDGTASLRSQFQDPKFRMIDSVVFATNAQVAQVITVEGKIDATGEVPTITVEAQLAGNSVATTSFELTQEQIIAYSYRRLCWSGETIVEAREDDPGVSDHSGCDDY